jgi:hypothetical protein
MRIHLVSGSLLAVFGLTSCHFPTAKNQSQSSFKSDAETIATQENANEEALRNEKEGYQSFAFYEGIKEDGKRSLSRSDGTTHGMPCIAKAVILKGEEIKFDFWHGHDRELHRFTLKIDDLAALKAGKSIEIFTAVVDRHKHAVKIDLEKSCKVAASN